MWEGGIGLRSARRSQPAAHWASWADALTMVKERHPIVADTILGALESGAETSSIQAILKGSQILCDAGFGSPAWGGLAEGRAPKVVEEEKDPCQPRFGWQQKASSAIEKHHIKVSVAATVGTRAADDAVSDVTQDPSERSRFAGFVPCLFAVVGVPSTRRSWPPPCSLHNSGCAEVGRWSQSQHGCAEKEVPEFGRMCSCVTWTWQNTAG